MDTRRSVAIRRRSPEDFKQTEFRGTKAGIADVGSKVFRRPLLREVHSWQQILDDLVGRDGSQDLWGVVDKFIAARGTPEEQLIVALVGEHLASAVAGPLGPKNESQARNADLDLSTARARQLLEDLVLLDMAEPLDSQSTTTDPVRGRRPATPGALQDQWDRSNAAAFEVAKYETALLGNTYEVSTLVIDGLDTEIPAR